MDFLTFVSQFTTVIADLLIILPFMSRTIRRKLFRAVITDIIYDIVANQDGQVSDMIKIMRTLITFYDISKGNTNISVVDKDD